MYTGTFTGSSTEVFGSITGYQGYFAGMVNSYNTPAYASGVTFSKPTASVTAVRKIAETCNSESGATISGWTATSTNPDTSNTILFSA